MCAVCCISTAGIRKGDQGRLIDWSWFKGSKGLLTSSSIQSNAPHLATAAKQLQANHPRAPLHASPCRCFILRHLLAYQERYRIAVLDKWAHLRMIGDLLFLPICCKAVEIFIEVTLLTKSIPRYLGGHLLAPTVDDWKTECGWMSKMRISVPPNSPSPLVN